MRRPRPVGTPPRTPAVLSVLAVLLVLPALACSPDADSGSDDEASGSTAASPTPTAGAAAPGEETPGMSALSPTPAPPETSSAEPPVFEGPRDPLLWPYPASSIWNHPRGDAARLVPFPLTTTQRTLAPEEDVLILAPDAPPRDVHLTTAGWDPKQTRCGSATEGVLVPGLPIPEGWTTDPGYFGTTPNQSAAILLADDTLVELQPFHICPDGTPVAQYASSAWRGSSILTGGIPGAIGGGSHGGSGLTAFGGTIRLGEWVPGGRIRHALKVTLDGSLLSNTDGGYRWPADRADAGYFDGYRGELPEARMGALLTLAPDFPVDALATEAARILARALVEYGAYVVDGAGRSTVGIAVEWGPQGRVLTEFSEEWGYSFTGRVDHAEGEHRDFLSDVVQIEAALQVVDDNGPETIGGAGDPLAPFAPPIETAR